MRISDWSSDVCSSDLTGNELSNRLVGNSANNILDGAGGSDVMIGGLGDDTYGVDDGSDRIVESEGAGTDTVNSSVSFPLASHLENLSLTGSAAINATGNEIGRAAVEDRVGRYV